MKIIFLFFLALNYLGASNFDVKKIQDEFFSKVILKPFDTREKLIAREKKFSIDAIYWQRAKKHLLKYKEKFKTSQFISFVDLKKQVFILVLYDAEVDDFFAIGFDFISSGDMSREAEVKSREDHYFKTPSGLFSIKSGWRSKGEMLDDNVTLPYGKKGSFVFYFGEQSSVRYNTFDVNGKKIKDIKKHKLIRDKLKFALHTHKSSLEFGVARSHGCIRMSEELNSFLDNNLVFFKHLYKGKKWIHPYKKPPKHPKNHPLAGEYLLVVDSVD
ncbi:hypothetical protein M947_01630 [Sulfurimonas hongkongensis]|uniref:L,D-TPase catalytic domain-containing protein n=1 Tax=Sulfurimonas hongkongensis TaxID=1172190 RepID=T0JTZ4_9BACT|nr:L,D-transpeptidase [Sulfurimonas hongkongensis]EQB40527.1 hypothetical protein M947_01630 [Sulfurimonas hongkongensis]